LAEKNLALLFSVSIFWYMGWNWRRSVGWWRQDRWINAARWKRCWICQLRLCWKIYSSQNETWMFVFCIFFLKHISTIERKTVFWQSTRSHATAHAARLTHASWPHAVSST